MWPNSQSISIKMGSFYLACYQESDSIVVSVYACVTKWASTAGGLFLNGICPTWQLSIKVEIMVQGHHVTLEIRSKNKFQNNQNAINSPFAGQI
jgi:hypothetical protein